MTNNEELGRLLEVLKKLPPPPRVPAAEDKILCLCGRERPLSIFPRIRTGVCVAVNNVCPECREGQREDAALAKLVCIGCKMVVGRIKPHKDYTGFEFKAGVAYHTEACGVCTPGLVKSIILEKMIWNRKQNIKENT